MARPRDELPTALHSAAQVRDLDARLIAAGTPGFTLMQRAAHAAWRALRRRWPQAGALTVLAGRGNNAGDGYLLAALALRAGWTARVLAVGDPQRLQGDAALACAEARQAGVAIESWSCEAQLDGVLVDALLGTGLSGTVREPYAGAIAAINASGLPVLAVDIPSGLCANTGKALGSVVHAQLTVSFIGLKFGLFAGVGPDVVGELVFDDLQADPARVAATPCLAQRLDARTAPRLAPRRPTDHKGRFGHVLVVGGELGTGGAGLLAAEAALRAGAGLVSLATRPENTAAILARRPEIMAAGLASANQLLPLLERADQLVVGPGLGQSAWGRSLLSAVAACARPQVWDADALNLLAAGTVQAPTDLLLTPHPGEAARLLGVETRQVQDDRRAAALELARRYRATVVLKGAGSLVAASDGRLMLCDQGHPAMASAGLGDVLAGLLGALRAQGLAAFEAACLGVWLHARAGMRLADGGRGLAAADLIPLIRELLEEHAPCLN
ncbi:MAG TPA: NAD(P)H-hydrate dehydratase [Pseudomonas sp.]|nr:NAD(P)H-hydrate dehydratase [Pseudomonas sp.]